MLEASLRMFYLQNIISLLFVLQLPYAFSPTLSCVHTLTQTHFIPSSDPVCSWCAVPLLCWVKIQRFSASAQSLSHKTFTCWSYLFVRHVLSSPFSAFFSLLNPPCRPISHMSVSGVFAIPEQSRLANGMKERRVEQGA